MKAITTWQPWASLIATENKHYETRGWKTNYRGPIAIHAAMREIIQTMRALPVETQKFVFECIYDYYHIRDGAIKKMPTGAIVATAEVVDCIKITPEFVATLSQKEQIFGDYTLGRYAWKLENVKLLPEPIPVKGKQGLWTFEAGCGTCRYNTNDIVAHPHCSGCDGISKYKQCPAKEENHESAQDH